MSSFFAPGSPPIPREHGAWAMLLTPPLAALLAEGPHPLGLMAMVGWFLAYTTRGPVEALAGKGASGRAGIAQAEPPVARFWLVVCGLLAFAFLGPVVWLQPKVAGLLVGSGAFLGIVYFLAARGETRSFAAGLLAVAGLMAGGPLYYLAAYGLVSPAAWALTFGCFAFFAGSIFRVKVLARERRSASFRHLSVLVHLGFALGAVVIAWLGWANWLLPVALLPPLYWAAHGARQAAGGSPANLGAVGKAEIWLTLAFALLLILAIRL